MDKVIEFSSINVLEELVIEIRKAKPGELALVQSKSLRDKGIYAFSYLDGRLAIVQKCSQ